MEWRAGRRGCRRERRREGENSNLFAAYVLIVTNDTTKYIYSYHIGTEDKDWQERLAQGLTTHHRIDTTNDTTIMIWVFSEWLLALCPHLRGSLSSAMAITMAATQAAPPMSPHIMSTLWEGLMETPPVSKVTPVCGGGEGREFFPQRNSHGTTHCFATNSCPSTNYHWYESLVSDFSTRPPAITWSSVLNAT